MNRLIALVGLVAAGLLSLPVPAPGQQQTTIETLDVFLDCQGVFCDFDHFRREITFVNWVRDRRDAHVHVLATSQQTGGGGREFTFAFIGLRQFADRSDTLRYTSRNTDTEAEVRDGQVHIIKLGLMRYVAQTQARERLTISSRIAGAAAPVGPVDDPWDYWVFRTSIGGSVDGESLQQSLSVNGSFSASRITEALKITLRTNGRYSRSEFELDSVTTYLDTQKNLVADGLVAFSLGPHWSAGIQTSARSSTRLNLDASLEGGLALEYDLFPYTESTRRQLTFLYTAGVSGFDYEQETIFDQTSEILPKHRFEIGLQVRQPWGSVSTSLEASQYLHDLARHQVNLSGGMQLRVFRGLQLNLFGGIGRIKDQIYLAKAGATEEEILLRRRQLGTDYSYRANVGFSYTFGSRFSNVVNPRLGGGGGFFFFF